MAETAFIDSYIAAAQPFAQPILAHIRAAVHRHCPQAAEAKKWGMPHFLYQGRILCSMAAFKAHSSLSFANGAEVVPDRAERKDGMGSFGRLTAISDLPGDNELAIMIGKQMALIESGAKMGAMVRNRAPKPEATLHPDLQAALAANPGADAIFKAFPPSHRREYAEWVNEAKRDETRAKRVATAVEWIAQGKGRNWKYEAC